MEPIYLDVSLLRLSAKLSKYGVFGIILFRRTPGVLMYTELWFDESSELLLHGNSLWDTVWPNRWYE